MFNVYNSNLGISIHQETIITIKTAYISTPPQVSSLTFIMILCVCAHMVTLDLRSTLLVDFNYNNIVLLIIAMMFYNKSPELILY